MDRVFRRLVKMRQPAGAPRFNRTEYRNVYSTRSVTSMHVNPKNAKAKGALRGPRGPLSAQACTERHKRVLSKGLFVRIVLGLCCAAVLLSSDAPAGAVERSTPLAELSSQAWVLENGLPQNTVQTLAQSALGYVWVGTEAGLARFDGSEFEVFDRSSHPSLPSGDIRCLLAARDGALWIGSAEGLARWKNGSMMFFSRHSGLPGDEIRGLVQTDDGVIWAWTDGGLARLSGDHFEAAGNEVPGETTRVLADGKGGLWVVTTRGMAAYENGHWTPVRRQGLWPQGSVVLAQRLPDGTLALASNRRLLLMRGGRAVKSLTVGRELPGTRIQTLLADREGSLWIGTNGGLARLVRGKLQLFAASEPLATASVLALMEDREGNLWVGTETVGLHILRDRRFFTFGMREGLASDATTTVVEDHAGTLWVGTMGWGLNALRLRKTGEDSETFPAHGAIRTYTVRDGLASNVILSLAAAPDGDLWVGTPDGLNRIRKGHIDTYTSADGLPDDFIRSLLVDSDGSLWIGTRHGLVHWMHEPGPQSQMKIYTRADGLGSDLVGAMARDAHGDLWVATLAGLSRLYKGSIVNFTTANGLGSNVATALLPRSDGTLLIGTENHGLYQWNGQRFSAAVPSGLDQTTIHAILNDGLGHLWFATGNGIARCDYTHPAAGNHAAGCSHWIEFGTADGLRTRQMATNSHPSAWRSRDGHLWFASPKGLVEVSPAHFRLNKLPPPVVLERFAVDDVDQPLHGNGTSLKIAAGHVHFQFDYAGLSFVAPQKVRYRYMLQGFDRKWTEAGARRSAYYTNIPPGNYTFRVEAANNDGVWNNTGAELSFDLQRHFYQTLWFYGLLLLAMAGSIFLVIRRRLRAAEREFSVVLGERSRIAREIHDTLAQGYVGVSVQLELLAELLRLQKLDAAAKQLDTTREYVREGLADARQSIWALRTQDSRDVRFPVKLRRMAEHAGSAQLTSHFSVFGAYRPLPAAKEREMLRVAQEAIHNVKKHAEASELFVRLEYGSEMIVLEVRDNGRGGAVAQESGFAPGHFGMTGMRERAEAIGGTLEVESEPGRGTTIRLRVPATAATRESDGRPQ